MVSVGAQRQSRTIRIHLPSLPELKIRAKKLPR
jgi:hypothetical protein